MNKQTLNTASTVLGIVAGLAQVLQQSHVIDSGLASTIGGIATALLGYLVHQPAQSPATPVPVSTPVPAPAPTQHK